MKPLLVLLLIAVSVLAVTHLLALEFYLYWLYLWLDIPMHMLGGAIVAMSLFVAADLGIPFFKHLLRPFIVIGIVLLIGLLWEHFELIFHLTTTHNYWQDTVLDLIMDIIGGYLGYIIGSRVGTLE